MDVARADRAVEPFISKNRPARLMQLGDQMAVGGIGRRIRQGHTGQGIEVAQAGTGQFQA
ncbi:hypothetical protein D3C76_1265470 [compost metagenome]